MSFQPLWGGVFRLQSFVHRKPEALPVEQIEAIRDALLQGARVALVSPSVLSRALATRS